VRRGVVFFFAVFFVVMRRISKFGDEFARELCAVARLRETIVCQRRCGGKVMEANISDA